MDISIGSFVFLGLYAAVVLVGAYLWFFVELRDRRQGRLLRSIGESALFGLLGAPVLIVCSMADQGQRCALKRAAALWRK